MTLVRWEPFRHRFPLRNMGAFQRGMSQMFDNLFEGDESTDVCQWSPSVDVVEMDDRFEFTTELPGMAKKDIKLELEDNVLSISGNKNSGYEKTDRNVYISERVYGSFRRSFRLPSKVESGKIKAEFDNGVLKVILPKAEEAKPKQIDIDIK